MAASVTVKFEGREVIISRDSRWRHTENMGLYKVLHLANSNANEARKKEYPLTIVYQGEDGSVWAKPPEEFLAKRIRIYPK